MYLGDIYMCTHIAHAHMYTHMHTIYLYNHVCASLLFLLQILRKDLMTLTTPSLKTSLNLQPLL